MEGVLGSSELSWDVQYKQMVCAKERVFCVCVYARPDPSSLRLIAGYLWQLIDMKSLVNRGIARCFNHAQNNGTQAGIALSTLTSEPRHEIGHPQY